MAPDFRSLTISYVADELQLELAFYPNTGRIGPGDFIRLDGTDSQVISFGSDAFELRSDLQRDGRYAQVLYEAPFDWLDDGRLLVRLPAALIGLFHERRVSVLSATSGDQAPDYGSLSLACPTTPPPSWTPTRTPTPVPAAEWRAVLIDARQKWERLGLTSYRYRHRLMCYCGLVSNALITVIRDEVAEVTSFYTGERVNPSLGVYGDFRYRTINEIFDLLESAIERPADSLAAEYHPTLGYPTSLYIDFDRRIFDEEIGIQASDIEAIVPPTLTASPVRSPTGTPTRTPTATPSQTPIPFVDNRDGTITDLRNGLVWEKKAGLDGLSNPDDPHDADNTYAWTGLCRDFAPCQPGGIVATPCQPPERCADCLASVGPCTPNETVFIWLAELNRHQFGGYDDWRLPSGQELHSLFDPALFGLGSMAPPPRVHVAFHRPGYRGDCRDATDPDCSATAVAPYWTSDPIPSLPNTGWAVSFQHPGGGSQTQPLSRHFHVRAVRRGR